MILHVASIAALFVDQVALSQCFVKCVQDAPTPEWKWWISALAPWIGPLLSGVVSIYIAWRVFHWQGEKDRKQWILDKKMAEWQELLKAAVHIRRIVSFGSENSEIRAQRIREGLKLAIQELEVSAEKCVFLSDFLGDEVKSERFYSFLRDVDLDAEKIDASFERSQRLQSPNPYLTDKDRDRAIEAYLLERGELAVKIGREFIGFNDWLHKEAAISLETLAPERRSAHKEDEVTP